MSCTVCKRRGCSESFHSLEEQEGDDGDLRQEVRLLTAERDAARAEAARLRAALVAIKNRTVVSDRDVFRIAVAALETGDERDGG